MLGLLLLYTRCGVQRVSRVQNPYTLSVYVYHIIGNSSGREQKRVTYIIMRSGRGYLRIGVLLTLFRTAVSFWGQLETNYMEFE